MYFSRLRFKNDIKYLVDLFRSGRDAYKQHELVWQLFPDDPTAKRDFLFHYTSLKNEPCYYILSKRKPIERAGMILETKVYQPSIQLQQIFRFTLRINPIVKLKIDNKSKQVDAIMHIKKQKKESDMPLRQSEYIYQAGQQWLEKRQEKYGFHVQGDLQIENYQTRRFYRSRENENDFIQISTLDYQGLLQVTDAKCFMETLYKGIGHGKAFGCGLLLIK